MNETSILAEWRSMEFTNDLLRSCRTYLLGMCSWTGRGKASLSHFTSAVSLLFCWTGGRSVQYSVVSAAGLWEIQCVGIRTNVQFEL